jgi:hypothetical protein
MHIHQHDGLPCQFYHSVSKLRLPSRKLHNTCRAAIPSVHSNRTPCRLRACH